MSDVSCEVKATANFDEWGNRQKYDIVKISESQLDLVKSYTGHNYDGVLGIYYAKARMCNSKNKRFLAVDIVKGEMQKPMSLVAYSYVLDNPFVYVDLDGEDAIVATSKKAAGSQGHTSSLVQDDNGGWHYFYWGLNNTVIFSVIIIGCEKSDELNDDLNAFSNGKTSKKLGVVQELNEWLNEYGAGETGKEAEDKLFGYTTGGEKPYTNATYVEGDFDDSLTYYKNLVNRTTITPGEDYKSFFGKEKWIEPKI